MVWIFRDAPKSWWVRTAAAMIIGGGIGNMIDRMALGYVVDFIDVRAIDFYVFNTADSFVCVGCAMVFVWTLYMEFVAKKPALDILLGTEKKEEPAEAAEADEKQAESQAESRENHHAE